MTYACVSGDEKCSFFKKFGVLCFLETLVLRFALLPYYRRNVFNNICFFLSKKFAFLQMVFKWSFAFFEIVDIKFSKFRLLSISTLWRVTIFLGLISMLFIFKILLLLDLFHLFIIILWNFSGFANILFSSNYFTATSLSFFDKFISLSMSSFVA